MTTGDAIENMGKTTNMTITTNGSGPRPFLGAAMIVGAMVDATIPHLADCASLIADAVIAAGLEGEPLPGDWIVDTTETEWSLTHAGVVLTHGDLDTDDDDGRINVGSGRLDWEVFMDDDTRPVAAELIRCVMDDEWLKSLVAKLAEE